MKLRILNNSLRLRLTRTEVDRAATDGIVQGSVDFPGGARFEYVLESSPASVSASASFRGAVLCIRLPQSEVVSWAGSDAVSIVAEQLLDNGQTLDIRVEKDFACLTPRDGEDESDMFPHPGKAGESC